MRACKASFGPQWLHRLLCHHVWHTDHTDVTICACCLEVGPR